MQAHPTTVSKLSSKYMALEEGLKQFSMDLNKLQVIPISPINVQVLTAAAIRRGQRYCFL
jgi:hypothetical protein